MATSPRRRVTQADVARIAGVSQATVSLVLRGDTPDRSRVGHQVRQRVLDATRATGYQPDPIAQRLAKGRNRIVGVFTFEAVFPHTSHDFYQPFLYGIEAEMEQLGYDLLLFTSVPAVNGRRRFQDGGSRLSITDGCLLLGRHLDRDDLVRLMQSDIPLVFIGRRETSAGTPPYVGADYVGATAHLVRVMIDHGHTRIGLLSDLGGDESYRDRVSGYRDAMATAGLRPTLLDHTEMTGDDAVDLIEANQLTAVLVGVGHLAEEIRVAASRRGLAVPRNLSLALLGQPEQALPEGIAWSGYSLPREEMGAAAARMLSRLISGEELIADDLAVVLPCTYDAGETIAAATA